VLGVPFRRFADAALPFAGLGMAVGRIGCLLQGCCHGRLCDLPWAMRFPAGSEAWANHVARGLVPSASTHSLPVHPLPLYLMATGVVVTSLLLWLRTRPRLPGEIALLGVVLISWPAAALELVREQELYAPVPLRSAIPLIVGGVALATWLWSRAATRRPVTASSA
jgi:phosphatidylglycerol:prolipoprotein diacylglycerol transferase